MFLPLRYKRNLDLNLNLQIHCISSDVRHVSNEFFERQYIVHVLQCDYWKVISVKEDKFIYPHVL